ncbi:NADAR family protein [Spirosoma telluris]|uniref:NADAR family protein n=1 Tax=Spirosoma telluris TaxID=2183553 RepID=UPI0012FA806A
MAAYSTQPARPLKYLFFWGHQPRKDGRISKSCFSQWYHSPFTLDGQLYPTAEHYMMAEKARLFADIDALGKILACQSPAEAKKLGRTVRDFNPTLWDNHCITIVIKANYHKFSQNPELRDFLLTTGNRILVEASPIDVIWGIGLAKDDIQAANPAQWPGKNLLGFALMEVREQLA